MPASNESSGGALQLPIGCTDEVTTIYAYVQGGVAVEIHRKFISSGFGQPRNSIILRCHQHTVFAFIIARLNSISIRAALSAALAVCFISVKTAQAEPHYRSWGWDDDDRSMPHYRSSGWSDYGPIKQKRQRAHTNYQSPQKAKSQEVRKGPLQIIISITDQQISVYDNGTLIALSSVSTGVPDHPTPIGVFSIIGKERWHRSNIYSAAPMPYMQRITWSGIALHAGVLPGHPASHGCIRLANDFAIRLWHLTKRGTRVIIARQDARPTEIANLHLFSSKPKTASSSPESSTDAVEGKDILALATSPTPLVPNAQNTNVPHPSGSASRKKVVPVSVLISRKLSKVFVRQGFSPLFDASIKIKDPEEPLGTHVLTAMEFQNDGASMRWTVISMREESSRTSAGLNGERKVSSVNRSPLPNNAGAVFDRIEIPDDIVERISEMLSPGSSIIISDYGISSETGQDTDFIVVTH